MRRYERFAVALTGFLAAKHLLRSGMTFADHATFVAAWLSDRSSTS